MKRAKRSIMKAYVEIFKEAFPTFSKRFINGIVINEQQKSISFDVEVDSLKYKAVLRIGLETEIITIFETMVTILENTSTKTLEVPLGASRRKYKLPPKSQVAWVGERTILEKTLRDYLNRIEYENRKVMLNPKNKVILQYKMIPFSNKSAVKKFLKRKTPILYVDLIDELN